jgi:hypothetical protein
MKKLKYWAAYLVVLTMIFTSCSKEETDLNNPQEQDLIQLQFGALLNDLSSKQAIKDHLDPPACSETDPSYVHVALRYPDDSWVDGKDGDNEQFIQIPINWNPNTLLWETAYSPVLGLPAATYSLEYFIVYNSLNEVIWVAPREGGAYEDYVPNPLPEDIVLVAGSKPYVSVDVLCFDTRQEDAYGYIFFDLNTYRAENSYCIFVNYCDRGEGGDGREYPAKFMVEAWKDAYGGSEAINLNPNMNVISPGPAASVLCFNLPALLGEDTHFIRVTILDDNLLPYNVDEQDPPVYEFEVTQAMIDGQLNLTPKYHHIRMNCEEDNGNGDECLTNPNGPDCDPDGDGLSNREEDDKGTDRNMPDTDGDGIDDGEDACPLIGQGVDQVDPDGDGCWTDPTEECSTVIQCDIGDDPDTDNSGGCQFTFIDGNSGDHIFVKVIDQNQIFSLKNVVNEPYGQLFTEFNSEDDLVVTINNNVFDEPISKYEIEVHPADNDGNIIESCQDMVCEDAVQADTSSLDVVLQNDVIKNYPFYIRVKSTGCFLSN